MSTNNPQPPKEKKEPSEKMKQLVKQREEVRAQLTALLGKGARVGNAASFLSKPAAERNLAAFAEQIKRRDEAAAAAKAAAKGAEKKLNVIKEESKTLAKTAKKNAKAIKEVAKEAVKVEKAKSKSKTRKINKPFKFKYNSVEREAGKLVKQAEELQKKLDTVNVQLKDVCKLCKDFQENTPAK